MKDDHKLKNLVDLIETDKDLIMTMEDAPFFDNDNEVQLENKDTSHMKQLLQQKISKDYITYSDSDKKLGITLTDLNKDNQENQEIIKGKKYEFKGSKAFKTDYAIGSVKNKASKMKSRVISTAGMDDLGSGKPESIQNLELNEENDFEALLDIEREKVLRKKIKEKLEAEKLANENRCVLNKVDIVNDKLAFLSTIPTVKDNLLVEKLTNANPEIKISNAGIASILNHFPNNAKSFQASTAKTELLLNTKDKVLGTNQSLPANKTVGDLNMKAQPLMKQQDKKIDEEINKEEKPDEPFVGKGVSNFLHIISKRGYLNSYEFVGKARNNPFKKHLKDDSGVVIEHRDHLGRVMTEKEAHKYLSVQFQGKSKGKRKLEKTLLKDQIFETNKSKDVNNSTFTLSILRSMQARTKTPEFCLNSNRPAN